MNSSAVLRILEGVSRESSLHPSYLLPHYERQYPFILELFFSVGIHPNQPKRIFNPYTNELCEETFGNIGEHCIAVAHCAEKICQALVERGVLDDAERSRIVERALIHDITKPYEIMRRRAVEEGRISDTYSASAYSKLKSLLLGRGYSKSLANYLVHAGQENGHNSLKDFIAPISEKRIALTSGKLPEKIVHLADDMTYTGDLLSGTNTTRFLTPLERVALLKLSRKYPFLWQEGLGVDKYGEVILLKNIVELEPGTILLGHYASLQAKVSNLICAELKKLIAPTVSQRSDEFLKAVVLAS
jgi:hypothetical protein